MSIINFGSGLSEMGKSIADTAGSAGLMAQKAELENQKEVLASQLAEGRETRLQTLRHGQDLENIGAQGDQSRQTVGAQGEQSRQTAGYVNTLPMTASEEAANKIAQKNADTSRMMVNKAPEEVRIAEWLKNASPDQKAAFNESLMAKTGMPLWMIEGSGQGATGGSSSSSANGQSGGKMNTDALSKIPAAQQSIIKGMIEGRISPPTSFAMSKPYWQTMIAAAAAVDPDFDQTTWQSRVATRKDFTAGQSAKAVTAMNTALGHAGRVLDNMAKLDNFGGLGTPLNAPINAIESTFGDARQTKVKEDVGALASEARKVFAASGGGNLTELESWEKNFPLNGSPTQQKGALQEFVGLLDSRLGALANQYNRGMGRTEDPVNLLDPHAQQVYERLTGTTPDEATGYQKGNAGKPAAPVAALPPLESREVGKVYSTPTGPHRWMGTGWAPEPNGGR